jgi:hypothetical protein
MKVNGVIYQYVPNIVGGEHFNPVTDKDTINRARLVLSDINVVFFKEMAGIPDADPLDRIRSFSTWMLYL